MSGHDDDRDMRAVARVREVRERDSRVGLLQALAQVRAREEELATLRQALAEAQTRAADTVEEFVTSRNFLAAMAVGVREAEMRLHAGRIVATDAHHRWQADVTRVRAIEHLLEERALRRAAEADRAETRETEDIVARLHRRNNEVAI